MHANSFSTRRSCIEEEHLFMLTGIGGSKCVLTAEWYVILLGDIFFQCGLPTEAGIQSHYAASTVVSLINYLQANSSHISLLLQTSYREPVRKSLYFIRDDH